MEIEANAVNAATEGTVTPQPEAVETGESTVTVQPESVPETAPADAKPEQTKDENTIYKSMRLRAEQEAREQLAADHQKEIDAEYARVFATAKNPITGQPIRSKADYDAAVEAQNIVQDAEAKGITPQQEQENREKIRRELLENDPEIKKLRQEAETYKKEHVERVFSSDLEAIKAKYPEETAKTAEELGEDFIQIMAAGNGRLNALAVYSALKAQKEEKAPPVIGDITHTPPPEGDYYTDAELKALSSKDLDDPIVMAKAERSLALLK